MVSTIFWWMVRGLFLGPGLSRSIVTWDIFWNRWLQHVSPGILFHKIKLPFGCIRPFWSLLFQLDIEDWMLLRKVQMLIVNVLSLWDVVFLFVTVMMIWSCGFILAHLIYYSQHTDTNS